MANIRAKDLDVKASFASDDEVMFDSPSGTGTMTRDAFIAAVASIIVASPSTYKIATLDGSNKLTTSQDPSQAVSYKGTHNVSTNSPALADGSGTAGDTYQVSVAGSRNYGSGSLTLAVGDALVYNGSIWQQVAGVANILNGQSTASGARAVLQVNSKDESAQAVGKKMLAPSLYLNGTSSQVSVADDSKLSFTDGTNDTPFTVEGWVKASDLTSFPIVSKYGTSAALREWRFNVDASDKLTLLLIGTSGFSAFAISDAAITGYEGKLVHLCATYGGAGTTAPSGTAFTNAANEITLYVNGTAVASTATNNNGGSYPGMSNTAQALHIGRFDNSFKAGEFAEVRIHNRELSAAEVAELARGNDTGFADEWGGATATSGTLTIGKRYRLKDFITGDDFTNVGAGSNADGVEFIATGTTPTTWTNSSVVENIGVIADFRSENYIDGKWIDISNNNFVGTATSIVVTGGRKGIQIDTDGSSAGNKVLSVYNGSSNLAYIDDKGNANANSLAYGSPAALTIAAGAVTVTKSYHTIDTESAAASDDLDTISGGRAGQILFVQAANGARTVVLKDGTGNLKLSGDITLDNNEDVAMLVTPDGSTWYQAGFSNNGV